MDPSLLCDAVIYELQARGGISTLYREVLPRVQRDHGVEVQLLHGAGLRQPLPPGLAARPIAGWERALRPRRLWGGAPDAARSLALRRAAGRGGPGEVWHSTYFTRPRGWRGPALALVCDLIYEQFPELFGGAEEERLRRRMRRAVTEADHVLCISESARGEVLRRYGLEPSRASVMLLAAPPLAALASPPPPPTPGPYLLFVGQRWHYKNFAGLLEAYAGWRWREEVALVCAGGGGWAPSESEALSRLGLTGRVHLLGPVADPDLAALYAGARCYICPSLAEGFGLPVLEAMQCGTLAVLARAASLPEVGGECAFYFDPSDPEDMRAAMSAALEMGEAARAARLAAGRAWAGRFSWDRSAAVFAAALKALA